MREKERERIGVKESIGSNDAAGGTGEPKRGAAEGVEPKNYPEEILDT